MPFIIESLHSYRFDESSSTSLTSKLLRADRGPKAHTLDAARMSQLYLSSKSSEMSNRPFSMSDQISASKGSAIISTHPLSFSPRHITLLLSNTDSARITDGCATLISTG